ncbi:DUF4998 domain-containing protein [Bacteroides faecium]|uniref:F5/8 type C domain-containing protein n=1 Tax=Bacteroides faecium TaxID=2715212 RepID=A0A6H0KNB6_9BACE|nr:DUF4998 domain-containing protein [Bacteroides faecium]QIU94663.1 hypothetical protein BacF7301_11160 [Bacteroides faecium]
MKTLKYITIVLSAASLLASCDSMEDSYKDYLEGGEIVYRAKAKEVVAYSGYNRAKLAWTLEYPTQVVKCQIREGEKILAEIPVEYQDRLEFEYVLENLPEKTYTFSIYSMDKEGNSSIKSDVIVDVYGERYMNTLRTGRFVQAVLRQPDNANTALVILSTSISSKVVATEVYYKSISGEEKHERIDASVDKLLLDDVAEDSYFNLRDVWKPSDTAIDDFAAPVKECGASDIPTGLSRSFTYIYKTDPATVVATLSAARTDAGVVRSVIHYDDEDITVDPATLEVILTNVSDNAVISIETFIEDDEKEYVAPTLKVDANALVTKIAMDNWAVIGYSSQQETGESGGGHAEHAIDGDINTYWHTQYNPTKPDYPHYLTIDLQITATIRAIAVARRNGNNNFAAKMRLEVSPDNENWESAGEFTPNGTINGLQMYTLEKSLSGRYVKLTALKGVSANPYFCMSEMNLYE